MSSIPASILFKKANEMPKFDVDLTALAVMRMRLVVEAEDADAAEAKALTEEIIADGIWEYMGIDEDSEESRPVVSSVEVQS